MLFKNSSTRLFPVNTSITHVRILNCKIEKVEAGAFESLTSLRYLHLSYNEQLTSDSLGNITCGLQSTKIEILKLININKPVGLCIVLQEIHLKALANLKLKEIHLDCDC